MAAADGDTGPALGAMRDLRNLPPGAARAGARVGLFAVRVAVLPARVAVRAPIVRPGIDAFAGRLDREAHHALFEARRRLRVLADDVLAAPELQHAADRVLAGPLTDAVARSVGEHRVVERVAAEVLAETDVDRVVDAVLGDARTERLLLRILESRLLDELTDHVLAGPFTDAVARSVGEHRVVERVAAQVLAEADVDRVVDAVLGDPRTERLLLRVLESRLLDDLTAQVLDSPELQRVIEHIASSPAVRAAVNRETKSLAGDVVADARRRSERADDRVERSVRGWLRRPRPVSP
jgi:hypothetical protein